MFDELFRGIFSTSTERVISVGDFLLCVAAALFAGVVFAVAVSVGVHRSKSFLTSIAIIPAAVCVVIMVVNGNVGAGVAVAGAFSLVRFRSMPGSARDISAIFLAMGAGLIAGMGYLAYTVLFTLIACAALIVFTKLGDRAQRSSAFRAMKITIPESLDYTSVFDDLMEKYTRSCEVVSVKTVNMGSLFRITYNVRLINPDCEKQFIDELRTRNGNLEISISRQETMISEL